MIEEIVAKTKNNYEDLERTVANLGDQMKNIWRCIKDVIEAVNDLAEGEKKENTTKINIGTLKLP